MARKADADLLAELDALGSADQPSASAGASAPVPATNTAAAAQQPAVQSPTVTHPSGDDDGSSALEDIQKVLAAKASSAQTSRPITPRMSSSTTTSAGTGTTGSKRGAGGIEQHTPASSGRSSARTSEERGRNGAPSPLLAAQQTRSSAEAGRSYHQGYVPGEEALPLPQAERTGGASGGGGGWWGSMFSAATAAVSQAQNLAKEIRGNEEAQKWAEQVRGYGVGLQSLSTDLRSRALPTFTSLISHIAPPISAHERLQIHITHDILNYPSLDPLIYSTFSRVMAQVEGGDLLVIQRGSESRSRTASDPLRGYRGGVLASGGWTDGPWWRDESQKRDLGVVMGLKEGTRLARVSAESYAKEFFEAHGGVEEAARKASESLSESNPVRSSDIFLAIQAISYPTEKGLFAGDARDVEKESSITATVVDPDEAVDGAAGEDLVTFAIYLHDPVHSLSFSTISQAFPQKWAGWLDTASPTSPAGENAESGLPESILEIIAAGGVDPREWIAEWMEEILGLAVGVLAQSYVARRMGVGEGGLGRGKRRLEEDGLGGEAARAL